VTVQLSSVKVKWVNSEIGGCRGSSGARPTKVRNAWFKILLYFSSISQY